MSVPTPSDATIFANLHIIVVTFDGKREAALYILTSTSRRTPQCATRQHSFLLLIEANCAEFFPIAYQLIFYNEVVYCQLALAELAWSGHTVDVQPTSRSDSIGTRISSAISLLPRKISPVLRQQQAGIAMLAKTRSYSIRLLSNHISTKTSSISVKLCIRSLKFGRNRSSCISILCLEDGFMFFSMYLFSLA